MGSEHESGSGKTNFPPEIHFRSVFQISEKCGKQEKAESFFSSPSLSLGRAAAKKDLVLDNKKSTWRKDTNNTRAQRENSSYLALKQQQDYHETKAQTFFAASKTIFFSNESAISAATEQLDFFFSLQRNCFAWEKILMAP